MDQHELELLKKYAATDPELKSLWDDHVLYEKQVENWSTRLFAHPTDDKPSSSSKSRNLRVKPSLWPSLTV